MPYSEGAIVIPEVTGNIEIQAEAAQTYIPIENLVETYGVTPGYRISTSSGSNSARDGYCTVGSSNTAGHIIPCQAGDVIRIKGAIIPVQPATDTMVNWVPYNDLNGTYASNMANDIRQGFDSTYINTSLADANGVVAFTIKSMPSGRVGCRLSLKCSDTSNLIVTKNQEIV